jgi:hypothetical protein
VIRAWSAPFVLGGMLSTHAVCAEEAGTTALRRWSSEHALTLPQGRAELGVFRASHYGLSDRVELSLHPLWFFMLPHVEAKLRFAERGGLAAAVRGRLSYPTLFLGFVSRSGAGGLLPESSSPPQALQIEGDVVGTLTLARRHLASVALGLAVAPHTSFAPEEFPLLDFPFLYPRFAALYTPVVPRASYAVSGPIVAALFYDVTISAYLMPDLPDVGAAYAFEQAGELEYRFGEHVAVSLGLRASEAKYAYGKLFHWLPTADVRVGF